MKYGHATPRHNPEHHNRHLQLFVVGKQSSQKILTKRVYIIVYVLRFEMLYYPGSSIVYIVVYYVNMKM
jgi:hypothetical protein